MYERIVGPGWRDQPAVIRALHSEGEAVGRFEIRRGRCALARLIGWLCRFPPDGHGVLVQLRVRREGGGLLWQRRFGGVLVETRQDVRDGFLAETFGPVLCRFRLSCTKSGLVFDQVGAALRLHGWLLTLPAALSPEVKGRVAAEGDKARVHVEIRAPVCGLVLGYDGVAMPASVTQ